ncbi:MAG: hypothetical protein JWN65_2091 [Solirubrobacterales bacterium]|nr:hypothetical protein [Solirubrobacterales bacterium]
MPPIRIHGAALIALGLLALGGCGDTAPATPRPPTGTASTVSPATATTATPSPGRTTASTTTSAAVAASLPPALRRLPSRRATVWAVGDGADGGDGGRALATLIGAGKPSLFLYLGDVYETGTAAEFADNYDPVYGTFKRRTAPTPGNHDYPLHADGYTPYWQRSLGGALPDYYALSIAGWQVLSLNSEAPHDAASPQVAWLRARVRDGGSCRIAFWHRPRFSAGLHGDQADVAPLWDTVRGRAALVLNGHDHTSQRLKSIGGTTEIVAGAGGHAPYPLNVGDPRLAYGSTGTPTALELRLRPGRADVLFRRSDGTTLDHKTVRCRPPRPAGR